MQQVVPIPKPKTKESTTKQSTSSPVTKNESTFVDASENPLLALHERTGNKAMASLLQQKAKQKTNQKKEAEQKSKPEEKGDEKKSKEKTKDKGPIPAGTYTLNPSNVEEAPSAAWGNWRVYLDPGTISRIGYMLGLSRGGFFLHGDHANDGTAGCIGIQNPTKEDKIFTMIKQTKTSIKVIVSY